MPCTTILVGKKASYDGSTLVARNEDSGTGSYCPKKFIVVMPEDQPRHYVSVISKIEIDLPEDPCRYTCMPNAVEGEGLWAAAGINEYNVAMTATETITTNSRVQGIDPLTKEGVGEEDLVTITLPYIKSAREGVERLGMIHEKYGTYEMNGIAFQDVDEIWWFETIGAHHWMAKRVPDDCYVVGPNQLGIDSLDLVDAFGEKKDNMCSADLIDFIRDNFLDLSMDEVKLEENTDFDTRAAFGSHSDSDHSYNTPRAWFIERYLNPNSFDWDGPDADFTPESDDIFWGLMPEKKITIEDVKYVLSGYYQGTKYNPYLKYGDRSEAGRYRPIGINRNNFVSITQLRPYMPKDIMAVEWITYGSNAFNEVAPFYTNITRTPEYLANTTDKVSTDNFYWANRLIGALSDANFHECISTIDGYQLSMRSMGHNMIAKFDKEYKEEKPEDVLSFCEKANDDIADKVRDMTDKVLNDVLYITSNNMKNRFGRGDA